MMSRINGLVMVRNGSPGGRVDTSTGISRKTEQNKRCNKALFFLLFPAILFPEVRFLLLFRYYKGAN